MIVCRLGVLGSESTANHLAEPPAAASSSEESTSPWTLELAGAIGTNPLIGGIRVGVRHRHIYRRDRNNILLDGLYVQAGAHALTSGWTGNVGVHLEWLPHAMLGLRLQYEALFSFRFPSDLEVVLPLCRGSPTSGSEAYVSDPGSLGRSSRTKEVSTPRLPLRISPMPGRQGEEWIS